VAVASAGPYASLHLAPVSCLHPTTQFLTGWMPFLPSMLELDGSKKVDAQCDTLAAIVS